MISGRPRSWHTRAIADMSAHVPYGVGLTIKAAAASGWRLVQIGQSAGAEATLPSAPVRGKMGEIYGFTDFAVPRDVFREQYLGLVGHAGAGNIVFDLETYPLEQIAEAWQRQADGASAKIVVTLP